MSVAEGFYEVYKALPKKVQKEFRTLLNISSEEKVSVSVKALKNALKDVKQLKEDKIKARPITELFKELEKGN